MEAVTALLQHGRQTRGLTRSIQLLQICSQEPRLLDEFVHSGIWSVEAIISAAEGLC